MFLDKHYSLSILFWVFNRSRCIYRRLGVEPLSILFWVFLDHERDPYSPLDPIFLFSFEYSVTGLSLLWRSLGVLSILFWVFPLTSHVIRSLWKLFLFSFEYSVLLRTNLKSAKKTFYSLLSILEINQPYGNDTISIAFYSLLSIQGRPILGRRRSSKTFYSLLSILEKRYSTMKIDIQDAFLFSFEYSSYSHAHV